jgi:hypothetical protein
MVIATESSRRPAIGSKPDGSVEVGLDGEVSPTRRSPVKRLPADASRRPVSPGSMEFSGSVHSRMIVVERITTTPRETKGTLRGVGVVPYDRRCTQGLQ